MYKKIKKFLRNILPAYRVALRMEDCLYDIDYKFSLLNKKMETMFWYSIRNENESLCATKKRFFSTMPKAEGAIRNHQLLLMEMIEKVDYLCKCFNIVYWLEGGNLLGAVRHKGFIPWDDDFDIGMTRRDFEKLYDVLKENDELKISYLYDNKGMYAIPKILYREGREDCFIDIVVFEEVCCNSWNDIEKKWNSRSLLQKKLQGELSEKFRDNSDEGVSTVLSEEDDNLVLKGVCRQYANLISDCGDTNYLLLCMEFPKDMAITIRCYPKKCIFPLQQKEYEGVLLPQPSDRKLYLQSQYGDIYTLPNDFGSQRHLNLNEKILRDLI